MLKDLKQLWGIDIDYLRRYSKSYRVKSAILYIADLLFMGILIFFMYCNQVSFGSYAFITLSFTIFFMVLFKTWLDVNAWQAYRFYKKNRNKTVQFFDASVSTDVATNILFCMKSRKTVKGELGDYVNALLGLCAEDGYRARKLFELLNKYINDGSATIRVYYIASKKSNSVVDIQVLGEGVTNEEENTESVDDNSDIDNNITSEGTSEG